MRGEQTELKKTSITWSTILSKGIRDVIFLNINVNVFHLQLFSMRLYGVYWFTFYYFFLYNTYFYWRIIALQNFAVFCQTSTWNQPYVYPCPFEPPSHLPPIPSILVDTEYQFEFPEPYSKFPLTILHMVMWVSMLLFAYISPSPPLSPCP